MLWGVSMGKAQFPSNFNWQVNSPVTGFLPGPGPNQDVAGNSPKSGVLKSAASGTNTIYTNIIGLRQMDNVGLEITWTGTLTGTFSIMVSNSGINFYALTFNPALAQPAGTAGGYVVSMTALPFQYMFVQYTNASGTGTVVIYNQCKANNS